MYTTELHTYSPHHESTTMRFSLTILALSQLSGALYVGHGAMNPEKQRIKRAAQNKAPKSDTTRLFPQKPKQSMPGWKLPNTSNGEMNALTGQQFHPEQNDDMNDRGGSDTDVPTGHGVCRIRQCKGSGVLDKYYCGQHARCLQNYCQCDLGWKPASNIAMTRGQSGLEALTIWADAYSAGCVERCDSLSCSEVSPVNGCFDNGVVREGNVHDGVYQDPTVQGELATDSLQLGAIKAPGADAM